MPLAKWLYDPRQQDIFVSAGYPPLLNSAALLQQWNAKQMSSGGSLPYFDPTRYIDLLPRFARGAPAQWWWLPGRWGLASTGRTLYPSLPYACARLYKGDDVQQTLAALQAGVQAAQANPPSREVVSLGDICGATRP